MCLQVQWQCLSGSLCWMFFFGQMCTSQKCVALQKTQSQWRFGLSGFWGYSHSGHACPHLAQEVKAERTFELNQVVFILCKCNKGLGIRYSGSCFKWICVCSVFFQAELTVPVVPLWHIMLEKTAPLLFPCVTSPPAPSGEKVLRQRTSSTSFGAN